MAVNPDFVTVGVQILNGDGFWKLLSETVLNLLKKFFKAHKLSAEAVDFVFEYDFENHWWCSVGFFILK